MKKLNGVLSVVYGLLAYALFLGTFLYLIGFVGGLAVPKSIDTGQPGPLGQALLIDGLLLCAFAVQHSVMARRSFKRWWTRLVSPSVERSTYVLAATLTLALLLWQWRPIAQPVVWSVENPAARSLLEVISWAGWGLVLLSTFLINHFELFGLRQVFARLREREVPRSPFVVPLVYRVVRHPLYLGFLIAFWAAPVMSAGHLLFSLANTGYILLGIAFEERDLVAQHGSRYEHYREQVGMLVPRVSRYPAEEARPEGEEAPSTR